jgi:hypothetical protein
MPYPATIRDPSKEATSSSTTKLSNTEAELSNLVCLAEKEDREASQVKDKFEAEREKRNMTNKWRRTQAKAAKKQQELMTRVENSVRGRIGKKDLEQKGELYEKVFAEEMECEVKRMKNVENEMERMKEEERETERRKVARRRAGEDQRDWY